MNPNPLLTWNLLSINVTGIKINSSKQVNYHHETSKHAVISLASRNNRWYFFHKELHLLKLLVLGPQLTMVRLTFKNSTKQSNMGISEMCVTKPLKIVTFSKVLYTTFLFRINNSLACNTLEENLQMQLRFRHWTCMRCRSCTS